jgi:hypothetical protein
MPIVSIPSSIGGISIPGITNTAGGPLAALFGNSNSLINLQYPRNLTSDTLGHWIKFTALQTTQPNAVIANALNGELQATVKAAGNLIDTTTTQIGNFFNGAKSSDSLNVTMQDKNSQQVAVIALYMPDTVSFQYAAEYGSTSLTNMGVQLAGAAADKFGRSKRDKNTGKEKTTAIGAIASIGEGVFGNAGTGSDIAKLALRTQGLAFNPQLQMLFDGITFRSYQLAFTFTPYSAEEAETVKKIIQTFRQYAAPEIRSGAGGLFFNVPCSFNVEFFFKGKINSNITRVAESVIKGIDVNYAPNGWAAHNNGAPVQTTMTLDMQEIAIIDRKKIIEGY